jgi:regulator of sigma E protease
MNVVLAVVIFTIVYSIVGMPVETDKVKIVGVSKNSPAEMAGLKDGDTVLKVNEVEVKTGSGLTEEVGKYKGQKIKLETLNSKNEKQIIEILARENPPEGEGSMGIAISNTEMQKLKWYELYKGVGAGFKEAYFWGKVIFGGVVSMISNLVHGQAPKDVAGPFGMFQATKTIKQSQGFLAVVHFFGIVSVNLAVVNILPFPALDGGRIVFVIYELLTRKRANEKFEALVNNLGMAILLTLLLTITVSDVITAIKK